MSVQKESTPKTLVERGKAFAAVGDYTRAEEYLSSGLDQGADAREVLPALMDVCVKTGRYRAAIQHGEDHLRRYPNDVQTHVIVGALYAAINEGRAARLQLEPVVKDDGATSEVRPALRAQAHYLLAVVAREDSDAVATDRHFRAYLRLEPKGSHVEEAQAALLTRVVPVEQTSGADAGGLPRRIELSPGGDRDGG